MQSEAGSLGVNMRLELIFGILFVASIAILVPASAETEVLMVNVDPSNVDNRVDEEVNFDADCTVCTISALTSVYYLNMDEEEQIIENAYLKSDICYYSSIVIR